MEAFSVLLALCAGKSPVTGEFPSQRPVAQSFGIFFDLRLNKRLSKQSRRQWLKTPWCHYDITVMIHRKKAPFDIAQLKLNSRPQTVLKYALMLFLEYDVTAFLVCSVWHDMYIFLYLPIRFVNTLRPS